VTFDPQVLRSLIEQALLTESTLDRAASLWSACSAQVLSRNHGRANGTLRASDAGRCAREAWAEIHGKRDLPEDAPGILKMNTGSLVGAWLACLLGAALVEKGYAAHLEMALERDGITGHADLMVSKIVEGHCEPELIVEFKFSAWSGKHDGPKPYHIIQAAQYARMVGAPCFVVILYYPSTQARFDKVIGTRVSEPHIEPSQIYVTSEWIGETEKEYARLRKALGDEIPEGDPQEAFRCRSCRASFCELNKNPLNTRNHEAPITL
jgi:hypothetical protein